MCPAQTSLAIAIATVAACTAVFSTACGGDGPTDMTDSTAQPALSLQLVVDGFSSPVFLTHAGDDSTRLYVVERGGVIKVIRNDTVLPSPFLDISARVKGGGEQGLLSVAFHPQYAQNGWLYVYYTNLDGDSHISRFVVTADPDSADATSEQLVLFVTQPFDNHNGGLLTFGPDGMLYIGLGDGGSGGDPQGNGQNLGTLLGTILRIDIDGGTPYAVPSDNPFVNDAAARPEIWVYGMRNPWRFSFDRATGDLYIGDVGQEAFEEIDFQGAASTGGENYGWNVMEGAECFNAGSCDQSGLTLPVAEYSHAEGCSVTGGYVYRGSRVPAIAGRYFYADFCTGWIRSFRLVGDAAIDHRDHSAKLGTLSQVASFGEDASGELYVVTLGGSVHRISGP